MIWRGAIKDKEVLTQGARRAGRSACGRAPPRNSRREDRISGSNSYVIGAAAGPQAFPQAEISRVKSTAGTAPTITFRGAAPFALGALSASASLVSATGGRHERGPYLATQYARGLRRVCVCRRHLVWRILSQGGRRARELQTDQFEHRRERSLRCFGFRMLPSRSEAIRNPNAGPGFLPLDSGLALPTPPSPPGVSDRN